MTSRQTRSFAALALVAALASCGPGGGDPHGGEHSVTASDRAFRVWYLAPPWIEDTRTGDHTVLRVPTLMNPQAAPALLESSIVLTIDVSPLGVTEALAQTAASARAGDDQLLVAPRPVAIATGSAVETAIGGGQHVVRVVAASIAGSRTLVLAFESANRIQDDDEVTAMIGQVETSGIGP